jgi:uncharacterized RDD family membrane protein YckC
VSGDAAATDAALPGTPAPLGPRIAAGLIDAFGLAVLTAALYLVPLRTGALALPLLGAVVAIVAYSVVPSAAFRATLGMRLCGVEIVGMDGRSADFTELLARDLLGRGLLGFAYFSTAIVGLVGFLAHIIYFFQPHGIGLILFFSSGAILVLAFCGQMLIFTRTDRRGLPDLMAKTVVIERGTLKQPDGPLQPDEEERAMMKGAASRRVRNVAIFELALLGGALVLPYVLGRPFNPEADFFARAKIAGLEQHFNADPVSDRATGELIYLLRATGDEKKAEEIENRHVEAIRTQSAGREKDLREALDRNPKDWDAFSSLIEILERSSRVDEAKASFQSFVDADPTPDNHASFGVWLYKHRFPSPAIGELEKAIADGESSADTRAYLGWAYLELDRKKEAREAFLDALDLDPDLDEVQHDLEAIDDNAALGLDRARESE